MSELYAYSLDCIQEGVFFVESNQVTFINKSLQTLIGANHHQCHISSIDFLPVTDRTSFACTFETTEVGRPTRCHCGMISTRGVVEVEICVNKLDAKRACCTVTSKEAIESLKDIDCKYLKLVDQYSQLLWSCLEYYTNEQDVQILSVSHAMFVYSTETLGIAANKLLGHFAIHDVAWNELDLDTWAQNVSDMDERNSKKVVKVNANAPNGLVFSMESTILFIGRSTRGNPLFLTINRDTTTEQTAVVQLERAQKDMMDVSESMRVFARFFDVSPILMGTIVLTPDDRIVTVLANNAFAALYGKSMEEMKGYDLSTLPYHQTELGKREIAFWVSAYKECRRTNKPLTIESNETGFRVIDDQGQREVRVAGPNERRSSQAKFSVCIISVGNDQFGFLAQDITFRRELEAELRQSKMHLEDIVAQRTTELERAVHVKTRFLATMSHEIRTPLTGITSSMSLLADSQLSPDQLSVLRIGLVCTDQLLVVINDILDITKLDEKKVDIEQIPFSIRAVLEDSLEVVAFAAEKKNVDIVSDLSPTLPEVVIGDSSRLRQIVINLLSNAVKFSHKGEILLHATATDISLHEAEIKVFVRDEGIGIPESSKAKLFEPFTQADISMTRRYGGSGLGLSICKRLVELMHGKLWFESQEGKGSTFYFSVILPKTLSTTTKEFPPECRGKRVIVAVASQSRQAMIASRLSLWGYIPIIPPTVESVNMEWIQAQNPDIIIKEYTHDEEFIISLGFFKPVLVIGFSLPPSLGQFPFLKKPIREEALRNSLILLTAENLRNSTKHRKIEKSTAPKHTQRILLAEDNIMNQKIVKKLLFKFGFVHIDAVNDGRAAIAQVRQHYYDIVLMDLMMPEMNGIDATEVIRKELSVDQQPRAIIALTADAFSDTKERCLKAGMQDVITKPIRHDLLQQVLTKYTTT